MAQLLWQQTRPKIPLRAEALLRRSKIPNSIK
jgi:hypothetical protein